MKLKVYEEKKGKTIHLKLQETKDNINLMVVNEDGVPTFNGTILSINSKGLYIYNGLNKDAGLPLGKDGVIKYNIENEK